MPSSKLIKNSEILKIYDTLSNIKASLDLPLHRFRVVALRKRMQPIVESINETVNEQNKYVPKEFFAAKDKLIRSLSVMDERGEPVIEDLGNGQRRYKLADGKIPEFNAAFTALCDEHKGAVDTYNDEIKKANDFMNAESEINVEKVLNIAWFNKSMTQDWIDTLYDFIDEAPEA